jgi:hypothetical protein
MISTYENSLERRGFDGYLDFLSSLASKLAGLINWPEVSRTKSDVFSLGTMLGLAFATVVTSLASAIGIRDLVVVPRCSRCFGESPMIPLLVVEDGE